MRPARRIHNLPHQAARRRELRAQLTPAEARLWIELKGGKLQGRKFRRQHSIGAWILDFYCPQEKLAVELDGAAHDSTQAELRDTRRDAWLRAQGVRVLRYENRLVFEELEAVLEEIAANFGG
ncbi:MAG: DUF559 domain-containing protein [Betaproteobacteria bacterium]|nr:DUF559 domain-containing protein [Betaproteobacteria bacterium]